MHLAVVSGYPQKRWPHPKQWENWQGLSSSVLSAATLSSTSIAVKYTLIWRNSTNTCARNGRYHGCLTVAFVRAAETLTQREVWPGVLVHCLLADLGYINVWALHQNPVCCNVCRKFFILLMSQCPCPCPCLSWRGGPFPAVGVAVDAISFLSSSLSSVSPSPSPSPVLLTTILFCVFCFQILMNAKMTARVRMFAITALTAPAPTSPGPLYSLMAHVWVSLFLNVLIDTRWIYVRIGPVRCPVHTHRCTNAIYLFPHLVENPVHDGVDSTVCACTALVAIVCEVQVFSKL